MDSVEEQVAVMLRTVRDKSGISRDFMSKQLDVSKKTIQNWEEGYSLPNIKHFYNWFKVCDFPLYPSMLRMNNPALMTITANSSDEEVREAFRNVIDTMDIHYMRQHFLEMFGETGTAPEGMGEVKTAYLHLPMYVKVGIAEIICTQFEIAQARNELVKPDIVMPNIDILKNYIDKAKQAVINGKSTYL